MPKILVVDDELDARVRERLGNPGQIPLAGSLPSVQRNRGFKLLRARAASPPDNPIVRPMRETAR